MNADRAILLSLIMNFDSLSTSRNVEQKQLAIDITDNEDFNNVEQKLAPNNEAETNPKSIKEIENIESFLYIYSPYPVKATFTKADNTTFTLNCEDITLIRDSFTRVSIVNTHKSQPSVIRLIYS